MKKIIKILAAAAVVVVLTSCLGAAADISIRADGSGKIALEYRVSQMLESMGRLDGNERWPVVPVGKADFERSVARIPGLRLSSFSAKDTANASGGRDLVTKAALEFSDANALLAFLDSTGPQMHGGAVWMENATRPSPSESSNAEIGGLASASPAGGGHASLSQSNGKNLLRLVLLEPSFTIANDDLKSLLREVSAGYEFSISLSAPKNANIAMTPQSVPAARLVSQGKKVSFTIGTGELLNLDNGLALEITW